MAQADYLTIPIRALITGADGKPSTSPASAAHAVFLAALEGHRVRPIPLDPAASDIEERANHLRGVLIALTVYVTAILDDTAQNIPGGVELGDIDALLSDLASDVTGTIQLAADAMAAGRIA